MTSGRGVEKYIALEKSMEQREFLECGRMKTLHVEFDPRDAIIGRLFEIGEKIKEGQVKGPGWWVR